MHTTLAKVIKDFLTEQQSFAKLSEYPQDISTDSRSIKAGDLFIPLKGTNFDGHQYIFTSLKQGAHAALSELDTEQLKSLPQYSEELLVKVLVVDSTLEAYHKLAHNYRFAINPLCIGITGSSGKTTTKELMKAVLSKKYKTHSTEANFNNEIGVPKTILEMPEATEVLIIEMAMRGLHQIDLLSRTANPNIALITNIGTAHIEILGSVENIRKAKMEILAGLNDYAGSRKIAATLIIDSELYDFCNSHNFIDPNTGEKISAKKILSFDSSPKYKINGLVSAGLMADVNAVALVAKALEMSDSEIQAGFLDYNPGKGRGEFLRDTNGNLYIDETYNANPEAIKNSVNALIEQFPESNKVAVIGKVLESHETLITELFNTLEAISRSGKITLIDARNKEINEITQEIEKSLVKNKPNTILVKASRGAKLERIFTEKQFN